MLTEPRGVGLLMSLRSADELRPAEFKIRGADDAIDPDMVVVAETIITQAKGKFDPADFRDSYQDAPRELVENKLKGIVTTPRQFAPPPKVINLVEALKRSLGTTPVQAKAMRGKHVDSRQPQVLMPVAGGGKANKPVAAAKAAPPAAAPTGRSKKAS